MNISLIVCAAILSYLIGSVPFGLIFTRLIAGVDVRTVGSGNIGATNVLRAAGKKAAVLTLLSDCAKGFVPAIVANIFSEFPTLGVVCGISAVLGHNYPIFLGFKGGKGVATSLGVMLALTPWIALVCLVVWLASATIWKYSSLAALLAFAAYPGIVFPLLSDNRPLQFLALFLFSMIYYRHRDNIKRLLAGSESKIGEKK